MKSKLYWIVVLFMEMASAIFVNFLLKLRIEIFSFFDTFIYDRPPRIDVCKIESLDLLPCRIEHVDTF